jgi:hypothetical protein
MAEFFESLLAFPDQGSRFGPKGTAKIVPSCHVVKQFLHPLKVFVIFLQIGKMEILCP